MSASPPRGIRMARPTQPVADALLVVALLAFLAVVAPTPVVTGVAGTPHVTLGGAWNEPWWAWTLQAALVVPLAWRRRAPLPVLALVAGVAFVQWLAGPALYGDLALLVAIYTVVSRDSSVQAYGLTLSVAIAAGVLGAERWAGDTTLATVVSLAATLLVIPAAVGVAVRARRQAIAAARESAAQAERTRIAREMHDVVAHNVSVMIALAEGARLVADSDPARSAAAAAQISATGRGALDEMRGILGVLRDQDDDAPRDPQPGIEELDRVVAAVRGAGIDVRLDVVPGAALTPSAALAVHRIVQEALTNVLKHGRGVTRVDVSVGRRGDRVAVAVADDGRVGATPVAPEGFGLRGMSERAAALGGHLGAGPRSAGGWEVQAELSSPLGARG